MPAEDCATVRKVRIDEITPNYRRGGDIRVVLSPTLTGSTSGFMGIVTLEPGQGVTEHYHPYSEEFLYIVRGAMTATVDDRVIELVADEAIMVPIGIRHRLTNNGTETAAAVFHLSPLAPKPALGHVDTEPVADPAAPQPSIGVW
ncbi:cupin domain-containing protein [Streptomyces sp. NPDC004232]|uniref:cupin domain-containing protein n=1 Tax=Streptomyces sp. NPDC004232 TaxID=3154454 RepID=UPI0033B0DF57